MKVDVIPYILVATNISEKTVTKMQAVLSCTCARKHGITVQKTVISRDGTFRPLLQLASRQNVQVSRNVIYQFQKRTADEHVGSASTL
jgi:hypothetical protein